MAKLAKKFFDPDEANIMADMDLLPLSRLLYMTLRLCHGFHDSGIGIVRINEMMNKTGIDRSCITEVLLPELKRNELVYYDNSIIFIPQIPIAEGFAGKILGQEKKEGARKGDTWMHKKSFVNHLIAIESYSKNLKSESSSGRMNTSILKAFELLEAEVNELVQYLNLQEELLISANNSDSSNEKDIINLQRTINDYNSSKLLVMYKNRNFSSQVSKSDANYSQVDIVTSGKSELTRLQTVSQNSPNSFETVSKPFQNPSETHQPKPPNPFETVLNPIPNTLPKNPKEFMVNGYMVNGYMVKNEEDSFLKIVGEGVGEPSAQEIFSPPLIFGEGLSSVEVATDATYDEPDQLEAEHATGRLHLLVRDTHTGLNLNGSISNHSKALHGKSIIDNVLRADGMAHIDSLDRGAEVGDNEVFDDGKIVESGFD